MSKKRKKKKKKKEHLDDLREPADEDQFEEKALQEEVIPLRRLIVRGDTTEMTQMPMDLKRAVNEAAELKSEIDEYEETVAEKDRLIKKLYENVDSLVDTEQDLELKLQHAEEECVKLKHEMNEMDDDIEVLKELLLPAFSGADDQLPGGRTGELADLEQDLEDRENSLLMKEQELLAWERDLVDREKELEIQEEKLSDHRDDLRMKELQIEECEREAMENQHLSSGGTSNGGGGCSSSFEVEEKQREINTLKRKLALKIDEVHELRGQLSRPLTGDIDIRSGGSRNETESLKQRIVGCEAVGREMQQSHDEEVRGLQMGADERMQKRLDQDEVMTRQIEALGLESRGSDIHAQLNKKEEFAWRQQEEIDQVWQENATLKKEVKALLSRLKEATADVTAMQTFPRIIFNVEFTCYQT